MPQTEEIRLKKKYAVKISNKFSRESPYISNTFSREPPNVHTSFLVCRLSPRHSKDQTVRSRDPNILRLISSVSGTGAYCVWFGILAPVASFCVMYENLLRHNGAREGTPTQVNILGL